jgi:hypothetical protein
VPPYGRASRQARPQSLAESVEPSLDVETPSPGCLVQVGERTLQRVKHAFDSAQGLGSPAERGADIGIGHLRTLFGKIE